MKLKIHLKLFILSIGIILLGIFGLKSMTIIYDYIFSPYLFETKFMPLDIQAWGPRAITVDLKGNIYLIGVGIEKYNSKGKFITNFYPPSEEGGGLGSPEGIAVDTKGNIYVADAGKDCVSIFNSKEKFIGKLGGKESKSVQFYEPNDIAIDKEGNIYVVDANCIVRKFNSKGQLIDKWKVHNAELTQYSPSLVSIAIDLEGFVYLVYKWVITIENEEKSTPKNYQKYSYIYKFDASGKFITKWGDKGFPDEPFNTVEGIAIDSKGNILVVDCENHCIQVFDSEGNFKYIWGRFGRFTNGRLYLPEYITIDLEGNVYIIDYRGERIQKFKPNPIWK